jgi:aromatase
MTSSATTARTITIAHTVFVAAPAPAVFDLIADAARWPYLLAPVVHVEPLLGGSTHERLRLWTVSNGAVGSWTSRRRLDRENLRIRFQQERPPQAVASMAGEWVFVPLPGNATSVVLLHEFQATGEDAANTALIKQTVDRNSTAELAAVKSAAELGERLPALVHTFTESVVIRGSLREVYGFLYRAQDWPRSLPHVSRLIVDEAVPNVQTIEMDFQTPAGEARAMRLVRVCFPYDSIVYKQTQPPDALSAHVGGWHLQAFEGGVRVVAANTVMLRPEAIRAARPGSFERPGDVIERTLRENCLATLLHAKDVIEGGGDTPL